MHMLPHTTLTGIVFGFTTGLAVWFFYLAAQRSKRALLLLLAWLLVQGVVGLSGFYTSSTTLPPRMALLLVPPLLLIMALFATTAGRRWLDGLRLELLTLLHVVRFPVELVLFGLYLQKAVPKLMTFEGRNWDIVLGLTAPVVYYFARRKMLSGRPGLLLWNILGLASLLNIVVSALLSAPTPLQRFAFEQPNIAILHFPFVWLPGCVVPLVLLAHLAAIRQLAMGRYLPAAGCPALGETLRSCSVGQQAGQHQPPTNGNGKRLAKTGPEARQMV
ncbi:hypothetical protein ACFP2F_11610 [Hymenobacter artigasi]|uniref:Effector of murein hydrolase LrgA (UPF0299 family) n=1 Tax=Hymenobacter artigasi TaxID=2719616 RepID=A0ABX1HKG9_9BACT|nr:hypothetical protein [Hymenobacter artigasi]NKI89527.1 putative effector of murein hydrolase LrgA (UPF0299 family) [Hymenobacter artigasi]